MIRVSILQQKPGLKKQLWKNHFLWSLGLLGCVLLAWDLSFAAPLCTEILITDSSNRINRKLERKYNHTLEKVIQWDETFQTQLFNYSQAITKQNDHWRAVRIMNYGPFADLVSQRMHLLSQRSLNLNYQKKLKHSLKEIDQTQNQISSWQELRKNKKTETTLLLLQTAPYRDQKTPKTKKENELWFQSMDYVESLAAHPKKKFTKLELTKLAALLQGHSSSDTKRITDSDAQFLEADAISMIPTKDNNGKQVLDPENSLIAGAQKSQEIERLLKKIEKDKTHPLILAAQVHQIMTSIHPLKDHNNQFADLITNYVLMRAGYPPLIISKEANSSTTALFPLKNFQDQVTPEETIQIILEGIQTSQKLLTPN